jgi:hypothetical protein
MDRLFTFALPLACAGVPLVALADVPHIHFDMPYTVACRDVTPPEFAKNNPGQKLVEVRLEISSLLTAGHEKDLAQYFVRIESPQRTLTIVDYLPKTSHESPLAGPITMEKSTERMAVLGIGLSGHYEILSAVGPSAGIGQKKTSSVKYDLLPPLETVAASGTLDRGSAVFFKLKASPRQPLEGSREFGLVLRVPATWRADSLRVRCEAEGIRRGVVSTFDEHVNCGQRDFLVALYQEGDEQARHLADSFSRRRSVEVESRKSKVESHNGGKKQESWTMQMPAMPSLETVRR